MCHKYTKFVPFITMIVVAESGSTKCDWLMDDGSGQLIETFTMGFNPFFHTTDVVIENLKKNKEIIENASKIKALYFYGAGCSSEDRNAIIKEALCQVFENAHCQVGHDLNAAAYSTCEGKPGITCIIGTGSNSCYFDGENVHEEVPALGYVLGDEGSGSYFGKRIVSDFIYGRLPEDLMHDFRGRYGLSKEDVFSEVYHSSSANVFLASFMRFLVPHKEHPYFVDIIKNGLRHFADIHITCYSNYKEVPVHFVGSVAYYFRSYMEEIAEEMGFTIGNVNKNPVASLLDYHKKAESVA